MENKTTFYSMIVKSNKFMSQFFKPNHFDNGLKTITHLTSPN